MLFGFIIVALCIFPFTISLCAIAKEADKQMEKMWVEFNNKD